MALRLIGLLLAFALCGAGCGGDDEPEAVATTEAAAATSCVPATSDIMTPVGGRVSLENPDIRLRNGQLVESTEMTGIWFLSAELDGPGLEDEGDIATWATTSQFGGEAIYAVDELASEHSNFSAVADAEGISPDDAAAAESRNCVEG